MQIMTPEFRVSYPNLLKARPNKLKGNALEYSLVALFPLGADLSALKAIAEEALIGKFGADKSAWPKNIRSPFRLQEEKAKKNPETGKMELPAGHVEGAVFLNLRSERRVGVVDEDVQPITDATKIYGGCWLRCMVRAYAYDTGGNAGVNFGLGNVQFVRDDDVFSTNVSKPEDDFKPVAKKKGAAAGADATSLF